MLKVKKNKSELNNECDLLKMPWNAQSRRGAI